MIQKFKKYLRIKPFVLIGDHKPLLKLFNITHDSKNRKLIRWRISLSGYTFTFDHHEGDSLNRLMEDYLSRLADPTDEPKQYEMAGIIIPQQQLATVNINNKNRFSFNAWFRAIPLGIADLNCLQILFIIPCSPTNLFE